MDKNAIKKYAIWARRELISRVSQRAAYFEITEAGFGDPEADSVLGRVLSDEEKAQRQALIAQVRQKGYRQVMEEAAYTWFNRFVALRFMEVNGYLPTHVRVFTDEANQFRPQILTEAINMELDGLNMQKVYAFKNANDDDGLFKYMVIVQCKALSSILPGMFQRISDYTELLFPDNLLRDGSVLQQMIELIPEEDWKDAVQIIGWLYQYYNAEKKDEVFAALKKNVKITKENIPAATQLFTPDWIVRYMVENSLGRLWVEGHPNDELKATWKYYLEEAEQEPEVQAQLTEVRKEYAAMTPEQIKCIDPCCGSGHILAYLFDVLMQIYESYGYTTREAVSSIVQSNLYGLDIDDRAAQLAYFAVMMKARQYDRRFFSRGIQPHVYAIQESNGIDHAALEYFCNGDTKLKTAMDNIIKELHNAKEYGSILNVTPVDFSALYARFDEVRSDINMSKEAALNDLLPLVQAAETLSQKYDVVVTNPPYMGSASMGAKLADFVKKNYPDSKSDISTVCLEKAFSMCKSNGYIAMINIPVWMFLSSYEKLRGNLLSNDTLVNMVHPGRGIFGSDFGTVTFAFRKSIPGAYRGAYRRLFDQHGEVKSNEEREETLLSGKGAYLAQQSNFSKIPGSPVAYWVSEKFIENFISGKAIGDICPVKKGMDTSNNDRFLRLWHEVSARNFSFGNAESNYKWYPYDKGGNFRRWFGNKEYVVDFENNGAALESSTANLRSRHLYFKRHLTWSALTASSTSFRYSDHLGIFDSAGSSMFPTEEYMSYLLGLMNSCVFNAIMGVINPTINYGAGSVSQVPVILGNEKEVKSLVYENINFSRVDWDSFETSWDFKQYPLIRPVSTVADAYAKWEAECNDRFAHLKANEEELNRIFIDIYGLQDELTPEVADKDVTVHYLVDTKDDIPDSIQGSNYVLTRRDAVVSLISYAVGCMFGRYSLDVDGLVYAGGNFNAKYCRWVGYLGDRIDEAVDEDGHLIGGGWAGCSMFKYDGIRKDGKWVLSVFPPDTDNIIPICDDEYFEDDIVGRFVKFIETVYGSDTLEENLKFIADALGGKGTPRNVIRSYFLNDFYADHCKTYQKRPIYWLFDSGKKDGFKALIYMHRYAPDTIARIRTDYVHEQQARYRNAIADLESRIAAASTAERVKLNKTLAHLKDQDAELQDYEEKIHHLADQMIPIDLDDGVKVNYAKFQDVLAKIK